MKKIFYNFQHNFINSKFLTLFLYFIVFAFSITLYLQTTNYNISGIDDDSFINFMFDDYSVKDIFTKNVLLSDTSKTYYRPLLSFSFFIDNYINQSPSTMHTTNVLLHSFCCVILMFFLKRYYFSKYVSFLAALLFSAHPVNIFAVAWIPGRNELLLCIFLLLSLIFLFEYLKKKKTILLFFHLIFFITTLFTKESSIFFPLFYVLYWLIYDKQISKKFFTVLGIYIVAVLCFLTIYKTLSYNIFNPTRYLFNLIYNIKTVFDYYFSVYFFKIHFSAYFGTKILILGLISFSLSFLFSFFCNLDKNEKILCFILPIIIFAISLMAGQLFFQGSRIYIPLIFLIIPFCSFILKFLKEKIVYIILSVFIIISLNVTVSNCHFFQNELAFFEAIDTEYPNYNIFMSNLYSYNLLKYGYFEEASKKTTLIAQKTGYKNIFNLYVLSVVYMHEKNYSEAINILEKIVNFDKNSVYSKLIVCYNMLGNKEKSLYYYNMLLNINKGDINKTNEFIQREKNVL